MEIPMTVTITLAEYRQLLDAKTRLDMITRDIVERINAGESHYNVVEDELMRFATDTLHYKPMKEEKEDE